MPPIYVVQQNTKLRIRNRRLQVELEQEDGEVEVLSSTPLGQVSQVVLFGNVGLTTPAMDTLLLQESEVIFLTVHGEYRGRLVGPLTPHVPLRRAQYRRLEEEGFALRMAQGFVSAKLHHQRALLQRHQREERLAQVDEVIAQLGEAIESVPRKTTLAALRGLEGSGGAAYFRGLRGLFAPQWNFNDRNRRPPGDPVNVLLSFGYTLLTELCSSAVQAVGLDPYAGFLHEVAYNRPALGLDLCEEFRPVVDGVVLWCCRSGQLTPADFSPGPAERPVVLGDAGKRRFLQAYEQRMEQTYTHPLRGMRLTMRQCIVEQARQIADRMVNGPAGYQGMGFR